MINKLGNKGKKFLEQGYVYAPYVPLIVTPIVLLADKPLDQIAKLMRKMGYE